jgi:triosephosphate isomerase
MMRKKIVAGNWKMNNTLDEAVYLVDEILSKIEPSEVVKIIITPFPFLETINRKIGEVESIYVGAQNCSAMPFGAYTGEVSARMLHSVGCQYVLVGHSERRSYFNETSEDLVMKIKEALMNQLKPIFCIGESLDQREGGFYFEVIKSQLTEVLTHFTSSECQNILIAYEPIWAIGTGLTATAQQAQDIHQFIRSELALLFSEEIAQQTSILYGGSCNAKNASELFKCKDVDGGLIGGASLNADDFCAITASF